MRHSEIKHVVESRLGKINASWDNIIKHFGKEDIHDFRVELKKVRAFIRLTTTRLSGAGELKIPHHLKTMYRSAGMIRNLQLQQERFFEFIDGKQIGQQYQYVQILQSKEKEWKQKINDISDPKTLEAEEEMIIKALPSKLGKTTIKNYTRKKVGELNILMVSGHTDEELHQIRKILKDILYTLPYTGDYFFSFFKALQTKEKIEFLTDLLGEFQDACTCLQLLLPDYTKELSDPEEIKLLQTFLEQWALKKSNVKAAVCEKLDHIIQQSA